MGEDADRRFPLLLAGRARQQLRAYNSLLDRTLDPLHARRHTCATPSPRNNARPNANCAPASPRTAAARNSAGVTQLQSLVAIAGESAVCAAAPAATTQNKATVSNRQTRFMGESTGVGGWK